MTKKLCASILGQENKSQTINTLVKKGINWIHYDVMDGQFVPNISLQERELEFTIQNTIKHTKDLHLMVFDPFFWIKNYVDKVDYISFHYEATSIDDIRKIFRKFRNDKIGLAISPNTRISEIKEFLFDVSHILVMSVEPGRGGQKFLPSVVTKISELTSFKKKTNLPFFIQVDGGINNITSKYVLAAGATHLVSGSYLLNNLNKPNVVKNLLGF